MSTGLWEPGPDIPDAESQAIRQAAYHDYIEGIILHQTVQMDSASKVIEDQGLPLGEEIWENVNDFESAIESGDEERINFSTEVVFGDVLRSYVYSGVDIDKEIVLFYAKALGFKKKWLRNEIKPHPVTLSQVSADGPYSESGRDLTNHGKHVLLKLGIGSFPLRLAAKLRLPL